jgi:hypothetical protein
MNVIGIGDFQLIIPNLNAEVGNEYIIVDVKKKLIVGKVKVIEAPKSLALTEQYTKKEVIKDEVTN